MIPAGWLTAESASRLIRGGNGARGTVPVHAERTNGAYIPLYAVEPTGWRCFHCGDVFTDEGSARLHFGAREIDNPACVIKAGAEGSILKALRDAEQASANAMHALHEECSDFARAYHAQNARHQQALLAAEELGFERGLKAQLEAKTEPAPVMVPDEPDGAAIAECALFDDTLADRVAKNCKDDAHDPRWCSTCETREMAIDEYRRAVSAEVLRLNAAVDGGE